MVPQDWLALGCVLVAAAYLVRQAVRALKTDGCRGGCGTCPAARTAPQVVPVEELLHKRP